jgi:hypothetical protein
MSESINWGLTGQRKAEFDQMPKDEVQVCLLVIYRWYTCSTQCIEMLTYRLTSRQCKNWRSNIKCTEELVQNTTLPHDPSDPINEFSLLITTTWGINIAISQDSASSALLTLYTVLSMVCQVTAFKMLLPGWVPVPIQKVPDIPYSSILTDVLGISEFWKSSRVCSWN